MRKKELRNLTNRAKSFFAEFKNFDFNSLSEEAIQKLVDAHGLSVDKLVSEYSVAPLVF